MCNPNFFISVTQGIGSLHNNILAQGNAARGPIRIQQHLLTLTGISRSARSLLHRDMISCISDTVENNNIKSSAYMGSHNSSSTWRKWLNSGSLERSWQDLVLFAALEFHKKIFSKWRPKWWKIF